jgi:PKD repeat protein
MGSGPVSLYPRRASFGRALCAKPDRTDLLDPLAAMIPLRRLLLIAILTLVPRVASAQLEHALWYFGNRAGLDFRGGAPVPSLDNPDYQWEGTSTISDPRTGELLFHTDGDTVWNRAGAVMPNGTGLGGHLSSTQSTIIVPAPEDSTRYYIISTDAGEYYGGASAASWSIVDMTLEGGLGAVTKHKVLLHAPVAEKVAVVKHCNGRGYWVILHELRTDKFLVFYLSKNGFEGPREQSIGSVHTGSLEAGIGGMKLSPSGDRLALAIFSASTVDVFDFDRKTGTISNPIALPINELAYDVCFSPDGSKLYVSGEQARYVKQYDLQGRNSSAAIVATASVIFRSNHRWAAYEHMGQMQIGPDGRLYVAVRNEAQMSVITQPNLAGAACGYQHRSIPLGGRYGILGLPNLVYGLSDATLETCRPPRARFRASVVEICAGESVRFFDESFDDPHTWEWSFPGGTPARSTEREPGTVTYDVAGTHRAMLVCANANGTDTFTVDVRVNPHPAIDAGDDLTICTGGDATITTTATDAATYLWSPAIGLSCTTCADPVASPLVTTTYAVVATSAAGCSSSDQVTVTVAPYPIVEAGRDTSICAGEAIQLHGRGGDELMWTPAIGLSCTDCPDPIASPTTSMTYTLVTSNQGRCVAVDSVRVMVGTRPVADAGDDARVCLGESVTLEARGGSRYTWSPSEDLSCADCATPTARPSRTTTYFVQAYNVSGCISIDSVTVYVDPAPRVVHARLGAAPRVGIFPGSELELPVVLDDALDAANVGMLDLSIEYDPTIIRMTRATLDSTLTEGWTAVVTAEDRTAGRFAARLFAANGATLSGSGILARLRFESFINRGDSSTVRLAMALPSEECTRIETRPTVVRLDSICGLSERLMTATGDVYALEQNTPNPFNPSTTINFSLGLDGPTRVDILDVTGRTVATLVDATLAPGAYSLVWDAARQPSGLYYCRITSGAWSKTIAMTVAK